VTCESDVEEVCRDVLETEGRVHEKYAKVGARRLG